MNTHHEPEWKRLAAGAGSLEATLMPARPIEMGHAVQQPAGISYWQLAWGHKFLILGAIVFGALLGIGYDTLQTPLYTASTTVEVESGERPSALGQGDSQSNPAFADSATEMRILVSRRVLGRVIERMNLEMAPTTELHPTFFTRLRARIPLPFLRQEPMVQSREAISVASATVAARSVGASRLIELSCKSTSSEVAAKFLNTLIEENRTMSLDSRQARLQSNSTSMASQLDEAKNRLQQASDKLQDFQKNNTDFVADQDTLADSKLRSLQGDLSTIQADRIAKQARWELAKGTPQQSLPDVTRDPSLLALKTQLDGLRRDRAQLLVRLTPEHDKVKRIDAQIAQTEVTLQNEESAYLKRADEDYQEALRHEKLLSGAYHAQTRSVSGQAERASRFAMLKRDVEVQQQLYLTLLKNSTEASLNGLTPGDTIQVVDDAYQSDVPVSPKPMVDIPFAAFAGGGLAYGILWLLEMARRKKQTGLFDAPGRTQMILGVPELGVIPSTQVSRARRRLPRASRSDQLSLPGVIGEAKNGSTPTPAGEVWQEMQSSIVLSESFRQTLVSLLRNRPKDRNPIYVITSAGPGEGKTTLSANLARSMAEIGHRVLLVDADLRRPHLHNLLGKGDYPGLSDILTNSADIKDCDLDQYIQSTEIPNLNLMTHGLEKVESPAVLFFSPRVAQLAARLRSRFDFVLFDTAPSLPFPDARLWGKFSDGVVLVVRAGVTTREGAAATCQRFLADGIPVIGTILNDWAPKQPAKDSYYYTYEYYAKPRKKS